MSDEESTQEIDVDALRARARSSIEEDEERHGPHERETFRGPAVTKASAQEASADDDEVIEDITDDAEVALVTNEHRDRRDLVRQLRAVDPVDELLGAADEDVADVDEVAHDVDEVLGAHDVDEVLGAHDVDEVLGAHDEDERLPHHSLVDDDEREAAPHPADEPRSLIGTMPGHDVAQALRAMMGDVPDTPLSDEPVPPPRRPPYASDEGESETVTRMPAARDLGMSQPDWPIADETGAHSLGLTSEDDALPAFSLEDSTDDVAPVPTAFSPQLPPTELRPTPVPARPALDSLSITQTSTNARLLLAGLADSTGATRSDVESVLDATRATARAAVTDVVDELPSPRPPMDTVAGVDAELEASLPRFSLHSVSESPRLDDATGVEPVPPVVDEPPPMTALSPVGDVAPDDLAIDVHISSPDLGEARPSSESIAEVDIVELEPEEIVVEPAPPVVDRASFRPPPPPAAPAPVVAPTMDAEERELFEEGKFSLLVALYRQRLGLTDGPNKKAALLLKIANVYEQQLGDLNETWNAVVDAFETAPENEDVVAAIDRVAKAQERVGELADRVRKRMVPGAPDDKRVSYLAHVVYWYERVLGRGSEASPLVSDIERIDKVHPLVLKRAAQIAAMNGDVKTQREHLQRALERTARVAEKVTLELALASAWAGTPEAMKHYVAALTLDPTSIVALQGVKRLGKEKEQHAQVKWALERQAEVAQTEAERIDAMLELAELEETKFLKRELAAQLLEQVLTLEPSHPQALKGLERCYHALRDWPALARILALRAEHVFDKKAKVELYELAAEVHESKLGDPAGAIEVYKNLLLVEPKHRRSLTDLSRLFEKMGDWDNVALYKSRLAELAPTKRSSSQELVKLGDYLNTPERDPLAAKLQYEKAVQIDPANAAAWEAIQKIAQENGDDARVIECLEQRKKHTDIPRQRAAVLVELAKAQLRQGDEDAAQKSYEAAIRADSSNEAAAIAMLDAYTADERWAEAAPLCELLVNAAIRDRDVDSLFIRLRLQTRIAAALGDAERALTASMAALDARPHDLGAQADLLAVASQCSGSPSLQRAREHLLRIVDMLDDLSNDQLIKLAVLERELKDLDGAARCFEAARQRDPENAALTRQLADIYLEQLDFPRASKLKVDLARAAPTEEARFELLVEAGDIWAKRADELEKAATIYEEARQVRPADATLLATLRWLYTELADAEMLAGVLEDLVQAEENGPKKLETVLALVDVYRDKLNDPMRAVDALEVALDVDRKRLDLFEGVVRTLTETKDWDRLERSYRRMIARVKDDDEPQLMFLLFHQLGLIYRDRLGDASRAFDALDAASRLEPDNEEVRKIVIELLIVTDNLDNAVSRVREEIDRDPHQAELYAELYELFLRQHAFDKAWCCVNVLARLRTPTADQRRFHEDYAPMPLDRVPGQIVEQAWRSHIFHAEMDPALTNIFAMVTPALARMRFGQLRPEQRVGRPFTPNHSRLAAEIKQTFDNASEILAVDSPELLVADLNSVHPFAPALAPFGSVLVCGPAIEAQSVSLVYLVGKKLAEQRPELTARAFFPAEKELAMLLASAMRVARNEGTKEPTGSALDVGLAQALLPDEMARLRAAMMQALADNTAFDVKRWLQVADLSSMRAGLLICGDIEPARQAIGCEVAASSDLSPRDKLGELLKFAVSDLYSDLRGAIGVAVQA